MSETATVRTDALVVRFLQTQVLLQVGESDTGQRATLHVEANGSVGVSTPAHPDEAVIAAQHAQVRRYTAGALRSVADLLEAQAGALEASTEATGVRAR